MRDDVDVEDEDEEDASTTTERCLRVSVALSSHPVVVARSLGAVPRASGRSRRATG